MTVTRDTKNKLSKAKKSLEGFEVWVGKKAGEKAVKCGGPFAWSKIKKGPVTTPCDAAKSKRVCRPPPKSPRSGRAMLVPSIPHLHLTCSPLPCGRVAGTATLLSFSLALEKLSRLASSRYVSQAMVSAWAMRSLDVCKRSCHSIEKNSDPRRQGARANGRLRDTPTSWAGAGVLTSFSRPAAS